MLHLKTSPFNQRRADKQTQVRQMERERERNGKQTNKDFEVITVTSLFCRKGAKIV